jgi:hypothetical protein
MGLVSQRVEASLLWDSAWPKTTISAERLLPAACHGHCHQGLTGSRRKSIKQVGHLDISLSNLFNTCPGDSPGRQAAALPSATCLATEMLLWEPDRDFKQLLCLLCHQGQLSSFVQVRRGGRGWRLGQLIFYIFFSARCIMIFNHIISSLQSIFI